ncbi:MAG: Gfo/Idh/MocA family oxidoreductase [Rhodospirillaceae bacterium]
MSALKTIIVGFGKVASGMNADPRMAKYFDHASHASVLKAHPAFDWLGVVDPSATAQKDARENWNIPHVSADITDIAAKVQPDVAVIATPPGMRAEIARQLSGVRAILVEKPLNAITNAMTGDGDADGVRLQETCGPRGVPVLVNYWRRADRLFQTLAAGELEKRVGRVQAIFGVYGNGLANNGSHMIDFIRMLTGEIIRVQSTGPAQAAKASTVAGDINMPVALTLANGATALLSPVDFDAYREVGLDIWGTEGRLSILQEGLVVRHFARTANRGVDNEWEIDSDWGVELERTVADALYRMYDNLVAAANDGRAWSPLSSALVNERIIKELMKSAAAEGAWQALD